MKYIKGFDKDLKCRGYQFEVGKDYKIESDRELELCSATGFHFCENIQQVDRFYSCRPNEKNRFCEIEVLGELVKDEEKCVSNHIRVVREIKGAELNKLLGMINGNSGIFNTGNSNTGNSNTGKRNTGHWNTGDCNTGNCNTGDWNTGDWNTGNSNTGDSNTGHCNTGDWNTGNSNTGDSNTGHWNTGHCNTGNCNTGHCNTGNCNTGHCNTGNSNTGDSNTGHWNSCNRSTGLFNTEEQEIYIFNKPSGMTYNEFYNSKYYDALYSVSFVLTEWIYYTEEEIKNSIIRQAIRGYLKKYTYEEACANWWSAMSEDNKKIILSIPNFDKDVFKEITGIEV